MDKKKLILMIVALAVILYVDFNFIMRMQFDSIAAVKPKAAQLKRDLDTLTRELSSMGELKRKQAQLKEKMPAMNKKIISEEELPSLLEGISLMANKNNVKIMQIKPVKEARKDDKKIPAAKFIPLSVNVDLSGDYHRIGSFINNLENAPQMISVENIKITNVKSDYLNQSASLVLKAYVRK